MEKIFTTNYKAKDEIIFSNEANCQVYEDWLDKKLIFYYGHDKSSTLLDSDIRKNEKFFLEIFREIVSIKVSNTANVGALVESLNILNPENFRVINVSGEETGADYFIFDWAFGNTWVMFSNKRNDFYKTF